MTAWVYLALHGTYGVLWVLKSYIFGDKQWEQPAKPIRAVMLASGLSMYWISPVIITYFWVEAHPAQIAAIKQRVLRADTRRCVARATSLLDAEDPRDQGVRLVAG